MTLVPKAVKPTPFVVPWMKAGRGVARSVAPMDKPVVWMAPAVPPLIHLLVLTVPPLTTTGAPCVSKGAMPTHNTPAPPAPIPGAAISGNNVERQTANV